MAETIGDLIENETAEKITKAASKTIRGDPNKLIVQIDESPINY